MPKLIKELYYRLIPQPLHHAISAGYFHMREYRHRLVPRLFPGRASLYCPCCDAKLTGFTSANFEYHTELYNPDRYKGIRQDIICPFCRSFPRHRILAQWCGQHVDLFHGNGLYFAVESSMAKWLEAHQISFTSADLYHPADLKIDITDIRQPDRSWDWIICNHVLEHVTDFRLALKELYRILTPSGFLICSFPIDPELDTVVEETESVNKSLDQQRSGRILRFGQADHLRIFGMDSQSLLQAAGFEVDIIDGNTMPQSILPVVGPADYDANYLFLCRKPSE